MSPLGGLQNRSSSQRLVVADAPPSSFLGLMTVQQARMAAKAEHWSRLMHKWAFPPKDNHRYLAPSTFVEHATHVVVLRTIPNKTTAIQESQWKPEPRGSDMLRWTSRFVITFIALAVLTWYTVGNLKVEFSGSDDADGDEPVGARGRPCCAYCCATCTVMLSFLIFALSLLVLNAENAEFERHRDLAPGNTTLTFIEHNRTIHLTQVDSPGERAFEAGQGVALSVFVAIFVLCSWRHLSSVRIRLDLMTQFAFRGAALSSFTAGLLEVFGSMVVSATRMAITSNPQGQYLMEGFNIWTVIMMLLVGVSEEFAKYAAMVWGAWYKRDALRNRAAARCSCVWPVLIESPHAMMLVGLSVGFGFMVIENAGYLLTVACIEDEENVDAGDKPEVDLALRIMRLVTIIIRVLLNLHPYLSGIVAARFATVLLKEPRENDTVTSTELAWILWPSALVHASYDLLVTILPGVLGLLMPFLFWYGVRRQFRKLWDEQDQQDWSSSTVSAAETRGSDSPGESAVEVLALRSENERLKHELNSLRASVSSLPGPQPATEVPEEATASPPEVSPDA